MSSKISYSADVVCMVFYFIFHIEYYKGFAHQKVSGVKHDCCV